MSVVLSEDEIKRVKNGLIELNLVFEWHSNTLVDRLILKDYTEKMYENIVGKPRWSKWLVEN
jgi:hypothetical protein